MAPALTQTAEPPNLVDATCHAPDPNTSTGSLYENLKEIGRGVKTAQSSGKSFFESEKVLISNGDCAPSGLAPPAFGWAEGRPVPDSSSPCRSNMDEHPPPLPLCDSGGNCVSVQQQLPANCSILSNSTMGLQSCITNLSAGSAAVEKTVTPFASNPATQPQEDSSTLLNNQNELLALVGRDFDNVNDIIDTLQRLASNPELLDAAARDLEPESTALSGVTPTTTKTTPTALLPPSLQQQDVPRQSPEERAALFLGRLVERQRQLERRRLFLLRRLRRVTARGLGMTVSSQLNHLTRHVRTVVEEERAKRPPEKRAVEEPIGLEMLHKESMKAMSTSDLISLVRRVEASNNLQRLNDTVAAKKGETKEAIRLPSSLCAQLDTVASEMKAASLAHAAHDSDATESSSGGESCDENEVVYSNISTSYKPIRERAFYRYCRMRGWVASKWMWLQAQIADLDYKILQQQKLHTHIQKTKGAIQLDGESPPVKDRPPVRSPSHLNMQDPALTCIGSATPRTVVLNGYHPANKAEEAGIPHGLAGGGGHSNSGADGAGRGCARTAGVEKVKRRRYVRPSVAMLKRGWGATVNSTNKVKSVSSPVLCKCIPPLSCILCIKSRTSSGKNNNGISFSNNVLNSNKLPISLLNQSVSDKVSKVDLSFHPVLSKHSEMLQGELYNVVLRSAGWQQKALINKALTPKEDASGSINHFEPLSKRKKVKEHKRNGRRKHAREEAKEKITLIGSRRSVTEDDGDEGYDELSGWHVPIESSAQSSPCPSPALLDKPEKGEGRSARKHSTAGRQKQNSTSNSYDINNIVIPYSMAATSRVELLQYKEIPTPKWRVQEITPLPLSYTNNNNNEDEEEDISEEAILCRHRKSEEMERKKFLTYLQTRVNSTRSSRSRRADSSGTNTPDHPLSPRQLEPMETSPIGSPPDTPLLAPSEDSNHSSHASSKSTSQSTVLTLSLSSLQSSLLKSNPPPPSDTEENSSSCLRSYQKNSTVPTTAAVDTPPALRTRRLLSGGVGVQLDRVRSTVAEEQNEKDRLSPFPCRNFPLNENEFQDLMCENQCKGGHPSNKALTRTSSRSNSNSLSAPATTLPSHRALEGDGINTLTGTDVESGRDSPLSELTDSAPEEEGSWDDGGTPDWTISVVNDHCGGVVLTVQRN